MPIMPQANKPQNSVEGYLVVDKPKGKTAFHLVAVLRKRLGLRKIGHAGTLDPMATGVMVMLLGNYTKHSDRFLNQSKEYLAEVHLGRTTDSYDADGQPTGECSDMPTADQVASAIACFQGEIEQIPPMFSAKKINGQKLYTLARQGKEVERAPVRVQLQIELISYVYPLVTLRVHCSKGTYIRSLAHDLGAHLACGAHLSGLVRTKSGPFQLQHAISPTQLYADETDLKSFILKSPPTN